MSPTEKQIEKADRLRCPFCGSRGIDRHSHGYKVYYCTNCGANGPKIKVDWNTRSLTAAEAQEVKPRVKPLEWYEDVPGRPEADTPFECGYYLDQVYGGEKDELGWAFALWQMFGDEEVYPTIEAAKAAAQADYEARFLRALEGNT